MTLWSCPECRRQFGRPNQSHGCSPALSLDEYFSTGPAMERRRCASFIDLRQATDVDDQVREWLTEGYLESPS